MKQGHDITSIARQLREHISAKSKANMPPPVQLSVYDGSRQFTDGYVWALDGDKRVQCIAPGPLDLTAATVATQIVIMALPPNPDEPGGAYFLIGGGISGATNSRAPALMTTGVTVVGGGGGGTGTVTSVGFTAAPSGIFDVSGSPITTSGTIALSMDNQSANTVLRGPTSGGAATPSFGALVAADIPDISGSYVPNSLYDANTILKADSDNTPIALVMGASTILARLASGGIVAATTAQIKTLLAIAVADITDFASTIAGYIAKSIFTAKGSLIGASASATPVELTVGSNNQILTADSTQASGLKWATGAVTSLFQHFADAGNTTTGETDLYSDTTPASTLANNGDIIEAHYSGLTVSSATATRTFRAYFGGTKFFDSGAITTAAADTWVWDMRVTRESSTVVRASAALLINGVTITTYTGYIRITGLTLSGTNILKITGQAGGAGAATNDIVAKEGVVLLPASASALGANTALSNLSGVAINATLGLDTNNVYDVGSTTNGVRNAYISTGIQPVADNAVSFGATAKALLQLFSYLFAFKERSAPPTPASGDIYTYADTSHNMRQVSSLGMDDIQYHGDNAKHILVSNTTAETDLYNRTIKANSLGANGNLVFHMRGSVGNQSASTRTYRIRIYLGATTLMDVTLTVTVANSSQVFDISGALANYGAANTNIIAGKLSNVVDAGSVTPAVSNENLFVNTSAIDTTADAVFKVTVVMSTNLTTVSTRMIQSDTFGSFLGS